MASERWYEERDIAKRHHDLMAATHRQHAMDAAAYGNAHAMDHHLNMENLHQGRLDAVNAEILRQDIQDNDDEYLSIESGNSDDWDPPHYSGHRPYGYGEESDAFHQ